MADKPASLGSLFIKDLVRRVQDELLESQREREAAGQSAIFEVERLTLEVHFIATETSSVEGGLDFRILTFGGLRAGGSAGAEREQVHKITLSLVSPGLNADLPDLEVATPFRPREH